LDDVASGIGGFRIVGDTSSDRAGTSVSAAGDVNGDGFDDLIIGAPGNNIGGTNAGAAYVFFGDDISAIVTAQGTTDDDTLTGSAKADAMIGGFGDDLLIGNGGVDVLRGGAGDDGLFVGDANFFRIDGGRGIDTLFLSGDISLDLTTIGNTRISGIETIDLTGDNTSNTLTLSATDVASMTDNYTLTVQGDNTDAVITTDFWTNNGTVDISGQSFQSFMLNGKRLLIDPEVDTSGVLPVPLASATTTDSFHTNVLIGTAGDDVFVLPDTGFGQLDGRGGFDLVEFTGAG
jgi:hypothetical protein